MKAYIREKKIVLRGLRDKARTVVTVRTKLGAVFRFTVRVQKGKIKPCRITVPKKTLALRTGESIRAGVKVYPVTCTIKPQYISSNKKVVVIDSSMGIITAKKTGKTVITVICADIKKTFQVKVIP